MSKYKIPSGLIVIGILSITAALGIFLFPRLFSSTKEELLPSTLGGLPLNQASVGPEAVQGVVQLHGVDFPMEDAAIGQYGTNGEITLWISAEADETTAIELLNLMTEKINMGRSPFTSPITMEYLATTVYKLEGLGQQHYYWQSGELIVWLAVDRASADNVLKEAIEFYR